MKVLAVTPLWKGEEETMSSTTRRTVQLAVVLTLLAVSAQAVMVELLFRGDRSVSEAWVDGLTAPQLASAAVHIEEYPLHFRKAILKSLSSEGRAEVWSRTVNNFIEENAALTPPALELLKEVKSLAVPPTFADAGVASRSQLLDVAQRVRQLLGQRSYDQLFLHAGASDSIRFAALPARVRLQAYIETHFKALAAVDCNCTMLDPGSDCGGWRCSEAQGCDWEAFGCGIWYLYDCDGYCMPPQ